MSQIEGLGTPGTPVGGVLTVQGSPSGSSLPTNSKTFDGSGNAIGSINSAGLFNLAVSQSATNYVASTVNSTTTQLASNATFTGPLETAFNQQSYSILLACDQPGTLKLNQYINATDTVPVQSSIFNLTAGQAFARSGVVNGNYFNLSFKNTGAAATTTLNINTAYGTIPSATQLNNAPISINEINGIAVTPYLNGALPTRDAINGSIVFGNLSVGTTAVEAKVGAARLVGRGVLSIAPVDGVVYYGGAGVTTSNGTPIFKNEKASISATDNVPIYLVSAGTVNVRLIEGV